MFALKKKEGGGVIAQVESKRNQEPKKKKWEQCVAQEGLKPSTPQLRKSFDLLGMHKEVKGEPSLQEEMRGVAY